MNMTSANMYRKLEIVASKGSKNTALVNISLSLVYLKSPQLMRVLILLETEIQLL